MQSRSFADFFPSGANGLRMTGYWASLLLAAALTGCGDGLESTVHGTVTYNESPVASAIVDFQNTAAGPSAAGYTDASGNYTLMTGSSQGLPAGTYKAAVIPPKGSDLPAKYHAPATSGLVYDVVPGKNTIHIELE